MLSRPIHLTDEVIEAIDGELNYQASLGGTARADDVDHGVEGQLVSLNVYIRKAQEAWIDNAGPEQTLDILRKVAAIACRALILNGCPRR